MSELEDVKQEPVTILLAGKQRRLKLGMRAMARIEEELGGIAAVGALMRTKPFSTLPKILFWAIPKADAEGLTEDTVADAFDEEYNLEYGKDLVMQLMQRALPDSMKKEDKEDPTTAEGK